MQNISDSAFLSSKAVGWNARREEEKLNIKVLYRVLQTHADVAISAGNSLSSYSSRLVQSRRRLLSVMTSGVPTGQLQNLADQIDTYSAELRNLGNAAAKVSAVYRDTEVGLAGRGIRWAHSSPKMSPLYGSGQVSNSFFHRFMQEYREEFDWIALLSGSNYIYKFIRFYQDGRNLHNVKDYATYSSELYKFLKEAVQTAKNYRQIGNAVGGKTSAVWWFKNITGLKSVGRVSSYDDVWNRFTHNLTNKTSPFNLKNAYQDALGDFTGANGVGQSVAAWGGVALSGFLHYKENREEQAEQRAAGKEMSDARVIAETVTETAVETAVSIGAKVVVGAAVSAVMGTVGAPALVVAAASTAVVIGVNAGVKALTGKTATELISDAVLDVGEAAIHVVEATAKELKSAVGAVKSGVGSVCKWAKKLFT